VLNPAQPPARGGKYALVERERRFLLPAVPADRVVRRRRIADRYLEGTRLRLRQVCDLHTGSCELKLTQKIPAGQPGPVRGLITNTYLSPTEYDLLCTLPAAVLVKTRLSIPPLAVDVFDPPLQGLVIAEAEFNTDEEANAFSQPRTAIAEITDDPRLAGGSLARASRRELIRWLADYGIGPGNLHA
jgi:CYTH domain-containing protein